MPETLFELHSHLTGVTPYEFGLIWTTFWHNEKDLFLKFIIRVIQKVPQEILTFLLGKL